MSVAWKIPIFNANPEKVFDEIQSIGNKYTSKQIVDYARDEKTELHKCFEWDDTKAAEKWRLSQADKVVRCLVHTKDEETKKPTQLRVIYYSPEEKTYRPVKLIVQNKTEYERLLEQALAELRSFKQKYSMLSELDEILALID